MVPRAPRRSSPDTPRHRPPPADEHRDRPRFLRRRRRSGAVRHRVRAHVSRWPPLHTTFFDSRPVRRAPSARARADLAAPARYLAHSIALPLAVPAVCRVLLGDQGRGRPRAEQFDRLLEGRSNEGGCGPSFRTCTRRCATRGTSRRYLSQSSYPAPAKAAARLVATGDAALGSVDGATAGRRSLRSPGRSPERIERTWRREVDAVIYPPVRVDEIPLGTRDDGFLLIAARLLAYRRVDVAVRACTATRARAHRRRRGSGETHRLEALAGPSVTFRGHVDRQELLDLFTRCHAYLTPGIEDFGIAPCRGDGRRQACDRLREWWCHRNGRRWCHRHPRGTAGAGSASRMPSYRSTTSASIRLSSGSGLAALTRRAFGPSGTRSSTAAG